MDYRELAHLNFFEHVLPQFRFFVPMTITTATERVDMILFLLNVFLAIFGLINKKSALSLYAATGIEKAKSFVLFSVNGLACLFLTGCFFVSMFRWFRTTYRISRIT